MDMEEFEEESTFYERNHDVTFGIKKLNIQIFKIKNLFRYHTRLYKILQSWANVFTFHIYKEFNSLFSVVFISDY